MPVWRQSTVCHDLLVLAAIGPKVIGTYRGSQVGKSAGHVCVAGLMEWAKMEQFKVLYKAVKWLIIAKATGTDVPV